jgi:[ribosomal protein S5]-alanine N-acetyltransferase
MQPLNEIRTARLLMRQPNEADAPAIFERYAQDAGVSRFMSWTPHQSVDDTVAFLHRIIAENAAGRSHGYLIFARDIGTLLGSIGGAIEEHRMQFGYLLARDAWGKGFATEAATQFVASVLADAGIFRVQAYCDLENQASARVLEKAGLRFEGTLRRYLVLPNLGPEPRDVFIYAKVRD